MRGIGEPKDELEEAEQLAAALAASLSGLSLSGPSSTSTPAAASTATAPASGSVAGRRKAASVCIPSAASLPPASASRSTAARAKVAGRIIRAAQPPVAEQEDWAYCVWWVLDRADLVGVHTGSLRAWRAIEAALPEGGYCSSNSRLRRFNSLGEALDGYGVERRRHGAPAEPRVFFH